MYQTSHLQFSNRLQNLQKILPEETPLGALWLGDFRAATDLQQLQKNNIMTVITVAANLPVTYSPPIKHIVYNLDDKPTANIKQFFQVACEDIQEGLKVGSVLVHCAAGISRSATIVLAYLINTKDWTLSKGLTYVKSKRHIVYPNDGFMKQLMEYESEIVQRRQIKSLSSHNRCKTQDELHTGAQQYYKAITKSFHRKGSDHYQQRRL